VLAGSEAGSTLSLGALSAEVVSGGGFSDGWVSERATLLSI
jgi:hypothetical protein